MTAEMGPESEVIHNASYPVKPNLRDMRPESFAVKMKRTPRNARPRPAPKFFMSFRDISFWIRSAKTDYLLKRLRRKHGDDKLFDRLYTLRPDPWSATVTYYRYQPRKYDTMLSLLPNCTYSRALDLGCGLGIFSRLLAKKAEQVVGVDISHFAVGAARDSTALPNVAFRQADLRSLQSAAVGQFDLVVAADTIYYLPDLSESALEAAREQVVSVLAPGGTLLLVNHYFFQIDSQSRMTRKIHDCFGRSQEVRLRSECRRPFYLVTVLQRRGPRSAD
jgi:SAM-dependent methyltransferase